MVEREHAGGTCINEGCSPTKTMVASARIAYLANRAPEFGVHAGSVQVDMQEVRQRKRGLVSSWEAGTRSSIVNAGVEYIDGEAHFGGERIQEVRLNADGTRRLTAERIFINTGQRPRIPDIEGLEGIPYLDSTSIMELDKVPHNLFAALED